MTTNDIGQLDEMSAAALERAFSQVQHWITRMSKPHELPVKGSVLALDDQATHPRPLSHLALTALAAAVDHFHAAATLVSVGRVVHSHAQFTLLRAAMENAATAVYSLPGATGDVERHGRSTRADQGDGPGDEYASRDTNASTELPEEQLLGAGLS